MGFLSHLDDSFVTLRSMHKEDGVCVCEKQHTGFYF